jgi:hypothetical protein
MVSSVASAKEDFYHKFRAADSRPATKPVDFLWD